MLIAINFHYVRPEYDAPHAGIHGLKPAALRAQLELLSATGTFVSGARVLDAVEGGEPLPARALLITFDDGLAEQVEHALPVLDDMGIPAMFFANTLPLEGRVLHAHMLHYLRAYTAPPVLREGVRAQLAARSLERPEPPTAGTLARQYPYDSEEDGRLKYLLNFSIPARLREEIAAELFSQLFPRSEAELSAALYMNEAALRALAKRDQLGSHGHRHRPLAQLSSEDARRDVASSIAHFRRTVGRALPLYSYAYGGPEACSVNVAELLAETGHKVAFSMERAGNHSLEQPLLLARIDQNDAPGGKAPLWSTDAFFEQIPQRTTWMKP